MIIKKIRTLSKFIFWNNWGKPRILGRIFFTSTFGNFTHSKITRFLNEEDIVLDIGARKAPYTKYQKIKALVGIDIPSESEGYLGWEEDSFGFSNPNIYCVYGDCEKLPFHEDVFDKVIMTEVIEHIVNDNAALSEISRVLCKEGSLIITTPNGSQVKNNNPHHIRHYNPLDLEKLLKKYFEDVEIKVHFPNIGFYVKQYLPNNNFIIKKLFWKYYYELWLKFQGKLRYKEGYTIYATCSKPVNSNSSPDSNFALKKILVCPECKGNLFFATDCSTCKKCNKTYKNKNKIPYLL